MAFIGTTKVSDISEGTYVSDFLKTRTHDKISGVIFCDADGDLYIQQSSDGENWDVTNYSYNMYLANVTGETAHINANVPVPVSANNGWSFNEELILPFVRIVFVTEGSPAVFRLHARTNDSSVKY